jgi:DNA-binding transcriptional LysR family regulator
MLVMNPVHDDAIEFRDLRYFVACCEEGSLTAAAAKLRIGQPTLSYAMTRLEKRLGERLLERPANRRAGVRATAAGRILLARAHHVAVEVAGLRDDLAALKGGVSGALTIGSIQSLNATLLPRPLARFAVAHPGIAITLRTIASDGVVAAVREGRIELGFLAASVSGPSAGPSAGVELATVAREAFVLIARHDHPLAKLAEIPLRRLADQPLVLVPSDTSTGAIIHRACRQAGFTPRPVLALESGEALRETVRAGLGCTILSEGYLPPADPELRAIRLVDPIPRREVLVATRHEEPLSRAAAAFLAVLRHR